MPQSPSQQLTLALVDAEPVPAQPMAAQPTIIEPPGRQGQAPTFELLRSRRRTLSISVDRAIVKVRAPMRLSRAIIEEFVNEKRGWIEQQVDLQRRQQTEIYRAIDGACLPVAGQAITLRWQHRCPRSGKAVQRATARLDGQVLLLKMPAGDPAAVEQRATRLLLGWLQQRAIDTMTPLSERLALQLGLADRLSAVRFRRTRSKWGHCTSDGVIQYNPVLMLAPLYVIEYIVAHEVAHLRHPNHSRAFWNTVERVCADRERAEDWLDNEGHRLAIEPGGSR